LPIVAMGGFLFLARRVSPHPKGPVRPCPGLLPGDPGAPAGSLHCSNRAWRSGLPPSRLPAAALRRQPRFVARRHGLVSHCPAPSWPVQLPLSRAQASSAGRRTVRLELLGCQPLGLVLKFCSSPRASSRFRGLPSEVEEGSSCWIP